MLFGVIAQVMGGSRMSILFLIAFFAIGIVMLWLVDEHRGRALADEINKQAKVG